MAREKTRSSDLVIMNPEDNVAVSLREIKAGEELEATYKNSFLRIITKDHIPLGHKVSLTRIKKDEPIVKYGEIIGRAKKEISLGQHVHIHNVCDF